MLFPIGDDDRHLSKPAYVTWILLLGNVALFVVQLMDPMFTYGWSAHRRIRRGCRAGVHLPDAAPGRT